MSQTKVIGEKTEAIILTEFIKRDIPVSLPFGDNQKYDMLIDVEDKLYRIQCKTGWKKDNCIMFSACNTVSTSKGVYKKDYKGKIEFFAVYYPDNQKTYLIPVTAISKTQVKLRLIPTKNNQNKNINWASEYELDFQLKKLYGSVA